MTICKKLYGVPFLEIGHRFHHHQARMKWHLVASLVSVTSTNMLEVIDCGRRVTTPMNLYLSESTVSKNKRKVNFTSELLCLKSYYNKERIRCIGS